MQGIQAVHSMAGRMVASMDALMQYCMRSTTWYGWSCIDRWIHSVHSMVLPIVPMALLYRAYHRYSPSCVATPVVAEQRPQVHSTEDSVSTCVSTYDAPVVPACYHRACGPMVWYYGTSMHTPYG